MTKPFVCALLLSVPVFAAFASVVGAQQATPKPKVPLYYDWDAKQDKEVNDAVVSAVRVGDKLEVTSKSPYYMFYFRVAPPFNYDLDVHTKVLSPGQQIVIPDRHGSIRFDVGNFELQGLRVSYYSDFHMMSFGDPKPHISKGNFLIRFKPANSDEPEAPDPYAIDAKEDKSVNDAVISAVRHDNQLEVVSRAPFLLFWFRAVPPASDGSAEVRTKTLSPGQEFVLHDRHGQIQYKVMDFQTDGLLVHFDSHFNMMSFGETKPRISSGSFVVRFKSPATSTPVPQAK